MTSRRKKVLWIAGGIAGSLAVLLGALLVFVQTKSFSELARNKIISVLADSTGGRAEIGHFQFDPWSLTARIDGFVLHGTEPASAPPLATIKSLEVRIKLLSGFRKIVDLAYVGVDAPRVNIIANADGSTNIPEPKEKGKTSSSSPLETVVNLAIGEFRLNNGWISYADVKTPLTVRGDDLRVSFDFDHSRSVYQGFLKLNWLSVAKADASPLLVKVDIPVQIRRDGVSVTNARFDTDRSHILANASLSNPNKPDLSITTTARIFLPELAKSLQLPLATKDPTLPTMLTADINAHLDQSAHRIAVQRFQISLGKTELHASGTADPQTSGRVEFDGNLALAELGRLFELKSPQVSGGLTLQGEASIDAKNQYLVTGNLNSQGLGITQGDARLRVVSLSAPFKVMPHLIDLNSLRVGLAGGGQLVAHAAIEELSKFRCNGVLRNLTLSNLSNLLSGKPINYGGELNGNFSATGERSTSGSTFDAKVALGIRPTKTGVPVSGKIEANYVGASQFIKLKMAHVAFPASKIDITGSPNKILTFQLNSRNLQDFQPLMTMSIGGSSSMPVSLRQGAAEVNATVENALSSPRISGHAAMTNFVVQNREFNDLSLGVAASPSGVQIRDGHLSRNSMQVAFDGSAQLSKWRLVSHSIITSNVTVRQADLGDLLALAGTDSSNSRGLVEADVHIKGTYGDPLGSATVNLQKGVALGQPFDGASARVNLSHQLIALDALEVSAAGGQLTANGSYRHAADSLDTGTGTLHAQSRNVDLAQIVPLQKQREHLAGIVELTADVSGDASSQSTKQRFHVANLNFQCSANGLRIDNQNAGSVTAQAHTSGNNEIYTLRSNFAGSDIRVDGTTSLNNDYGTNASATIRNLAVERALLVAGQGDVPVRGMLTADANVSGAVTNPDVTLRVDLAKADIYHEQVSELRAEAHYTNDLVDLPLLHIVTPAGTVDGTGRYDHTQKGQNGTVRIHVASDGINLEKVSQLQQLEPGLGGTVRLTVDANGNIGQKSELAVSNVNADIKGSGLRMAGNALGDLSASARTRGSAVDFHFDSTLAQSEIQASGSTQLTTDYPTKAKVSFKNIHYKNFAPFLSVESTPTFDAIVEGNATVDGPILNRDALSGRLELSRLELLSSRRSISPPQLVQLRNEQPVVVSFKKQKLNIEHLSLGGRDTSFQSSGSIDFSNGGGELQLGVNGKLDLSILQELDRDFYSSGAILLDTKVLGTVSQPALAGQITLQNANINYAAAPNGLSNANGVIALSGSSAVIKNLTAECGGGKLVVTGYTGLSPSAVFYNLHAQATHVRTRFDDASITSSARLMLTGSSRRSLLSGSVVVERIAYSSSSDLGSLLSRTSLPPSTSSGNSPFLERLRLEINVTTSSSLRVSTAYVDKLELNSRLTVLGTADQPGLTGQINITDGQLVFFGNTYTVETGTINFYDSSAIHPELNFSLRTVVQGVNVTLGVRGPVSDMKLSYRSDPPLTFQQIVQLLATNTTPSDPTIAAHQPTPPQQSLSQMGESRLLSAAVANPLASRAQRIFGLNQFKIDPSISGSNGQPSAKVTLQQKIANNITFTYITDVTQSNSEIVRVQWDFNDRASAVALRDFNGNVSVQLFYKFQVR